MSYAQVRSPYKDGQRKPPGTALSAQSLGWRPEMVDRNGVRTFAVKNGGTAVAAGGTITVTGVDQSMVVIAAFTRNSSFGSQVLYGQGGSNSLPSISADDTIRMPSSHGVPANAYLVVVIGLAAGAQQ